MQTCYIGKDNLGNWILCKNEVNSIIRVKYYWFSYNPLVIDSMYLIDVGEVTCQEYPKWLVKIIEEDYLIKSNK